MMGNRFLGEATAKIGDQDWTLRCDFNAMAEFEDATGKDAMDTFEGVEEGQVSIKDLRHMVHAFLIYHHPAATLRDAGDILSNDMNVVQRLIGAAMPTADEAAELGNGQAATADNPG